MYKLASITVKLIILSVFLLSLTMAGTDGTIRGQLTDADGTPLPGGQVFIRSLSLGAVADAKGEYFIINIPVGTYDVTVMMMGYQTQTMRDVVVIMDKTLWLNFSLPIEAIEGEVVEIIGERELVEKGSTAKKVTVDRETVEALPIRDLTELYSLQSGVVKVESSFNGIPDHEERGLEEIHVRGGRTGEISYMIDGLYIRNPIFGGIGNGTRLNLFAVQEFDWQPGGFNAEYGDAMSAVSNMHTNVGGDKFAYKFKFETSGVGAAFGSEYDELRGYTDINLGFGGRFPGIDKLYYWISGQSTNRDNYRVYEFDDLIYEEFDPVTDPGNLVNKAKLVQPWDNVAGFRGFGFDKTEDIFGKFTYNPSNKLRLNASIWVVSAHRKGFSERYLYWDEGQNELFRDTHRYTIELNHSLSSRTFYTVRAARFIQDQFRGVRWRDNDDDGYPDWFEWRYSAGANRDISDPNNPNIIPYSTSTLGDTLYYTKRDNRSGWYHGAAPGIYNWEVAEEFTDLNGNGIYDEGEPWEDRAEPGYNAGIWDGPELVNTCIKRDGSYWIVPEMYEDYQDFFDWEIVEYEFVLDPWWFGNIGGTGPRYDGSLFNPYYFMPFGGGFTSGNSWEEDRTFGGTDRFYGNSTAETNEIRFDLTSQLTNKWKVRTGFDFKTHKLDFFEVMEPWLGEGAITQSFAEYWQDTGPDGLTLRDPEYEGPDFGENNGKWDKGEKYDDANGNGRWDNYREPKELSTYLQNTFEVPWMVINAGIRLDAVNYNTKIWADTLGDYSPGRPWYYQDSDGDGEWDPDEPVDDNPGFADERVLFKSANWFYKVSPRIGISHVITDKATFTFNYGLYYQTPRYSNVYLNTSQQEDPVQLFEETEGAIGNGTMSASRNQQYEFAFNVQFSKHWAFKLGAWIKYLDQMETTQHYRSGAYTYQVYTNSDYGNVKGIDFDLENRGQLINTNIQYTYSVAKANSEYDAAAIGSEASDAPSQEFLMYYDRTHDLTASLIFTKLPFNIRAGITGFYQSGAPYTPLIFEGRDPKEDSKNPNSKRAPDYRQVNLSFSRYLQIARHRIMLGLNVFNVLNIKNALVVWPLTGRPDDRGEYYTDQIGFPDADHDISNSYYDMPWRYYPPREINFFIQLDFE